MPERAADLGQVGFVKVSPVAGRFQIYSADLQVQRIFLRRDDQVRAISAQFAADLVANVGSDRDHGGRNAHSQSDRDASQQLAPFLPAEGFVDQASEHGYCWNMRLRAAMSASWMMTASEVNCAFRGTGLHPPGMPTD